MKRDEHLERARRLRNARVHTVEAQIAVGKAFGIASKEYHWFKPIIETIDVKLDSGHEAFFYEGHKEPCPYRPDPRAPKRGAI
jgi:hypothetical protein